MCYYMIENHFNLADPKGLHVIVVATYRSITEEGTAGRVDVDEWNEWNE